MLTKRLITLFIAASLCGNMIAFADSVEPSCEEIIIEGETAYDDSKAIGTVEEENRAPEIDVTSEDVGMELLFEETYDFETYYMDGSKITTSFNNNEGYRMWELRQGSQSHLLDVVESDRAGYGDMLRIATAAQSGGVFYAHNNGTGNYMPEVKDGVVVIDYDFNITKEALPTKNSAVFAQMMTTVSQQYVFPYVIRRDGDNISVNRDYNVNSAAIYKGPFPDGEWVKVRAVFDYTIGKWYSAYIDENNETHMLANGSNIPDMIKAAGIRSVRITHELSGNEEGKPVSLYADNFRCYKLNNVTTQGLGYPAIKEIADNYGRMARLNDFVYSPSAPAAFSENFSSYQEVPAALKVGNNENWSHAVSGEYLGGSIKVVEDPEDREKRALYMSSDAEGINQYVHKWIAPKSNEALSLDGKIRITDENSDVYIALGEQKAGFTNAELITLKNGRLYVGNAELLAVAADKWYNFNMLINPKDKTVFVSVNDSKDIFEATAAADISFEKPVRFTLGTDHEKNSAHGGVYFTDLNICSASDFTLTSEMISNKAELTLKPAIDLNFSNFVALEEVKKLVISSGEENVLYDVESVGNTVKSVTIIPKNDLSINTQYKIDLSAVHDIMGNTLAVAELTFKTGNPAIMDILDVAKISLIDEEEKKEYLTSGDLTVEIACTNVSSAPTDATVLLMLYDGYVMKKAVISEKTAIAVDENKVLTAAINVPGEKSSYRLRVCVWDSEENRFALTKSYVFDSTGMIIE